MSFQGAVFQLLLIYLTSIGFHCIPLKKNLPDVGEIAANASLSKDRLAQLRVAKTLNLYRLKELKSLRSSKEQQPVDLPQDLVESLGGGPSRHLSPGDLDSLIHKAAKKDEIYANEEEELLKEIQILNFLDSWDSRADVTWTRPATTESIKGHKPGSRPQELETWEQSDHLDADDYDQDKYFSLHDLDSNGFLDSEEVKAAVYPEAKRIHPSSQDEAEREALQMTQYVLDNVDEDKDRMISLAEHQVYLRSMQGQDNSDWENDDSLMQLDDAPSEKNLEVIEREVEKMQSDAPNSDVLQKIHERIDKLQMGIENATTTTTTTSV